MSKTLFYSWQSDDLETKRVIDMALTEAVKNITSSPEIERANRPELTRDTQGEVGAVDIADTILSKINKCEVFIADVSIYAEYQGRNLVNQNVMFELGYAVRNKGFESCILIANEDIAKVKELPFDINGKRAVRFSTKKCKNAKAYQRFVEELQAVISAHLSNDAISASESEIVKLSLEEKNPRAKRQALQFFKRAYNQLAEMSPSEIKPAQSFSDYAAGTFKSYAASYDIVEEWFEVVEYAVDYENWDVIIDAHDQIGAIVDHYPNANSLSKDISTEYYSLIVGELESLIFGLLAEHGQWGLINTLRNRKYKTNKILVRQWGVYETYQFPEYIQTYFNESRNLNKALPMADIMISRYVANERLAEAYISGNILLYLTARDTETRHQFYYPFSGIMLHYDSVSYRPDYFEKMASSHFFENFKDAFGFPGASGLRAHLKPKLVQELANRGVFMNSSLWPLIKDAAGLRSLDSLGFGE